VLQEFVSYRRRILDENGNIYQLELNPRKDEVIKELDLVEIPEDELSHVLNLNEKARIKWYKQHKVAV
jgi:hypothetical protein